MKLGVWLKKTQQWLINVPRLHRGDRRRKQLSRTSRHLFVEAMEQRLLLTGTANDPGEFFYSLTSPGQVFSSNNSKLWVDDSDIVKLSIASDGTWQHELFFDGSDVGLNHWEEDIDAFTIREDGSILISTLGCAHVPGVNHIDGGDLLLFRPSSTGAQTSGSWEMYLDGSDVGLSHWENIDAVTELTDGSLAISTQRNSQLPGIGHVRDEDLVRFDPTSTGTRTRGSWSRYIDGSDISLNGSHENIDGVTVGDDGSTVLLSTTGTAWVPGLVAKDEDVFAFEATQLGSHTTGDFADSLTLNGSRAGISPHYDIDAFHAALGDPGNPQPPVIDNIGDQTIDELTELSLTATATDADTPTANLTWSLVSGPESASIDAVTGQFSWTPSEADGPGSVQVTLAVSDGELTDSETFLITVNEVNSPPILESIGNRNVNGGTNFTFDADASDPDLPENTLTYSLSGDIPTGSTFDSQTGEFAWQTTAANSGTSYDITVTVTDGALTDSETFTLSVTNSGLQVQPIADQSVNELEQFAYQVEATGSSVGLPDIDFEAAGGRGLNAGDIITDQFAFLGIHVTTDDPDDHPAMIFDSSNPTGGDFDLGTPNQKFGGPGVGHGGKSGRWKNDVARGKILIISEDGDVSDPDDHARGGVLIFTFDSPTDIDAIGLLDVDSGRNTIRFYDAAGSIIGSKNIPRRGNNSAQTLDVNRIGVSRMEVDFAGSGAITDLFFSGDGTGGGALTYTLDAGAPQGMTIRDSGLIEWTPTEEQGPGTFDVTVLVSDGVSIVQETFQVAVSEVNVAPVIAAIDDQSIDELSALEIQVEATDADLPTNTLTYSLADGAPDGMTISSAGLIQWTPTEEQGPGVFPVTVEVSDGTLISTENFEITVGEVNVAPVIFAIDDQAIDELSALELQVEATDADLPGNTLMYSLADGAPNGMTISSAGLIQWTPTEEQGPGVFPVTVEVSDGTLISTEDFQVTVGEVNIAPVIVAIDDQAIDELSTLELQATATDDDLPANELTFALTGTIPSGMSITESGLLTWTPDESQGPGTYSVTIDVDDGQATDSQTFAVTVAEANRPPVIATIADQQHPELTPFELQVQATDPDLPANDLSYDLLQTDVPAGMTISESGLIEWTPGEADGPGTYTIDVEVSDGEFIDVETFTLTVTEQNTAPVLAAIDNLTVFPGNSISFDADATDSDLPANGLVYSLTGDVPAEATFDTATGQFAWAVPANATLGIRNLTVSVSDQQSGFDSQTLTITVEGPAISSITLVEDDRFETTGTQDIIIPAEPAYFEFEILNLAFDTDSTGRMNDAFEVALLDANGDSLVHTIAAERDAFFNVSEGHLQSTSVNADVNGNTVRVDLSHIPAGTEATIVYRLVNNDNGDAVDNQTTVTVTEGTVVAGDLATPAGVSAATATVNAAVDTTTLTDVTGSFQINYGSTSFNKDAQTLFANVDLANAASQPIDGPFVLVVENLTDPLVSVLDFDGRTTDGNPYVIVNAAANSLQSGEVSSTAKLSFLNPNETPFEYKLTVLAAPNEAPSIVSQPIVLVESGRPYAYGVNAIDPNENDVLTYELLTAPSGMVIDSASGEITWSPDTDDIGNNEVSVRVSDGRGGFDEQQFTVEVRDIVPNRPPVIISSPVVEAFVAPEENQITGNLVVNGDFEDGDTGFTTQYSNAGISVGAAQYSITTNPRINFSAATSYGDFTTGSGNMMAVNGSTTPGDVVWEQTVNVVPGRTYDFAAAISSWFPAAPAALLFTVNGEDIGALNAPSETGEWIQLFASWESDSSTEATIRIVNANIAFGGNDFALDGIYFGGPRFSNPSYQYDVDAIDADADPITYSLDQAPAGMSIDTDTGVIAWNPTADQLGQNTVRVTANDGRGGTATQEFEVVVLGDQGNDAPVIISDPVDDFFIPGFSNPASGDVTPQRISLDLGNGETFDGTVSITLPESAGRFADIVISVDESASMGGDQDWIPEMIPLLDNALKAEGIGAEAENPNRFAIVGGGRQNLVSYFFSQQANTKYTLYGPDNTVVADGITNEVLPDEILNLQLADDGRYVLIVEAANTADLPAGIDIGVEGEIGEGARVEQLQLNTLIVDEFLLPGQPVEYQFSLSTDTLLYFDSLTKDVYSTLNWELEGPTGVLATNKTFQNSDTTDSTPTYSAPAGEYKLTLDARFDTTSDYRFQLIDLGAGTTITSGQAVAGEFETKVETDAYRFTATAGQVFSFSNTISGFHAGSLWRLLDAGGNVLAVQAPGVNVSNVELPADGEYYLLMEAALFPNEGNQQLRIPSTYEFTATVEDAAPPTEIAFGETVTGTASFAGEISEYSFTLAERAYLYLDSLTDSGLTWSLTGPAGSTGNARFNGSDSFDNGDPVRDLVAGDYVLRVNGNVAGDFGFRLLNLADAEPVTPGTEFSGELTIPNETDMYRFSAAAGDEFYIDVTNASDTSNTLYRIYDQYGRELLEQRSLTAAAAIFEAPINGEYTLLVEGWRANTGLDLYSLNVVPKEVSTVPLTLGGITTGTLATPGAIAEFTFELTQDTQLYFDSLADNSELQWTLEGPRGEEITDRRFHVSDANSVTDISIDARAGSWKLTVEGRGDVTGGFGFILRDLLNDAQSTPITPAPGAANPSVSISATNGINTNESEVFRFDANAGDEFSFVTTIDGTTLANYRVLDSNGTEVVPFTGLLTDRLNVVLPRTDTYYLIVETRVGRTEPTDWTIDINFVQNNTITGLGGDTFTFGETLSGSLPEAFVGDGYIFTVTERGTYYFDSLTDNSSVRWNLDGPTGQVVNNRSFTGTDSFNQSNVGLNLIPGDYRIAVYSNNGAQDYEFRFLDLSEATPITLGTAFSNTLDPGNETHAYQFAANAGDELLFDVEVTSDANNTQYKLLDPFGRRVFTSSGLRDFGPTTLSFDGTYTLVVEGWRGNAGPDNYTLNVKQIPAATETALTLGNTYTGSHTESGQVSDFVFTLNEYTQVHFDTLNNSAYRWNLSNEISTVVNNRSFQQSDSYDVSQTVIELLPGTYRVRVTGQDASNDFEFRLLDIANATAITPDTATTSSHPNTRSTELFRLDAQAGDIVFFQSQSVSGFTTTTPWRLIDPFGDEVAEQNINSNFGPVTLQKTGTYHLLVEGRRSDTGADGEFTFEVVSLGNELNPVVPTSLSLDEVVSSEVAKPFEQDRYAFSLTEKSLLYFDALVSDSLVNWSLENDLGRTIIANRRFTQSDSNGIVNPVLSLRSGDYVLTVQSNTVRPYEFNLRNLARATEVTSGTPFNGEFTDSLESDVYRFSGSAGQQVYVDVLSALPNASGRIRIVDSQGQVLAVNTTLQDIEATTLPTDGHYFLLVESNVSSTTNTTYEMNLVTATTTEAELNLDEIQSGEIVNAGDTTEYTFSLNDLSNLYFDSLTDTGTINWTLKGPQGTEISARRLNASDSFDQSNPVISNLLPGDYTLTIDAALDAVGTFSFRVFDLQTNATPINFDAPISSDLERPNETDAYQFTASQGDSLLIDFQTVSDFSNTMYRVYDPIGREIIEVRNLGDFESSPLPADGTYTLLVEGWRANTGLDEYQLELATRSTRTSTINIGDTVNDSITELAEQVVYNFDVTDDTFLYLDSLTNNSQITWKLEGPTGEIVSPRTFTTTDSFNQTSPVFETRAGGYTLTVDGILDEVSSYSFRLLDTADATELTLPSTVGDTVAVRSGATVPTLAPANLTHAYRFTATSGDEVSFDVVSTNVQSAIYRLIDPFGRTQFSRSIGSDLNDILLESDGEYTLLVEGSVTSTFVGTYDLQIVYNGNTPPAPISGTALTFGTTYTETLTAGSGDAYQFTVTERTLAHMDSLTDSSSIRWNLRGPRGVEVSNRSFTGTDSINSPTSTLDLRPGTYQLDIFASDGTARDYSFTLHNFEDATAVTPGTAFPGAPDNLLGRQTDLYQFDAVAGERYLIDVVSVAATNAGEFKVVDPFGQVIATSVSGVRDLDQISIAIDGTYTLLVEGVRNNATPDAHELNVHRIENIDLALVSNQSNRETMTAGEELRYNFDVTERSLFLFTPQTNTASLEWSLAGDTGSFVDSRRFNQGQFPVDLPAGNYQLTVDGVNDYAGDAFFTGVIADESSQLVSQEIANGQLTTDRSVAVFQFNGTAGQHFALRPDFNLVFDDAATSAITAEDLSTGFDNEDGLSGIDVSLRNDVFRDGAALNFIVVTDEDRDILDDQATPEKIFGELSQRDALLNVIVNSRFQDENGTGVIGVDNEGNAYRADGSGGFTTSSGGVSTASNISIREDYINLAWALDGAAWDLNQLRVGGVTAESFTNAFVDVKVSEILEQTSLRLSASDETADVTYINPSTPVYDSIVGGQTYDFDIQIGNDGNPKSFDLLFTQGQTVGSIPVYIVNPYGYNAQAVDADGDALSWSLTEAPAGLVVDPVTGVLAWPADSVIYGEHPVTLQVSDGRGGFDEQSFVLDVNGGEAASISGRVQENLLPAFLATTVAANVPGSANPYLAGMPAGAIASGGDTAPAQSPVEVQGIDWFEGGMLTFTATGQVSRSGGTPNPSETPDGSLSGSGSHTAGAQNGISNLTSNYNSLVGVFLSDGQPNPASTPAPLDFINGSPSGPFDNVVSPVLQQPFFIGDGLNASGVRQEFVVPEGATRLFLATADSADWASNTGSFDVEITQTVGQAHVVDTMEFEGKTYQLIAGDEAGLGISWNDARAYAVRNGGSLAIVDNPALDAEIYNRWGDDPNTIGLWIGLTDRAEEGVFVWEGTGEIPSYTNWSPGEPNQFQGNNEDAVLIWGSGNPYGGTPSRWNDGIRTGVADGGRYIYAVVEVGRRLTETQTVYIDQNRNGLLDDDEPRETTDVDGFYSFENLSTGTYVVSQAPQPGWAQISPTGNYEFALQPGEDRAGVDFVNRPVTIVNTDPIIESTPTLQLTAGDEFVYLPAISEQDGDVLEFDLPLNPAGMAIDATTGRIVWQTSTDDIGRANVLLRVRDGRGGFDLQSFALQVEAPNVSPVITSTPPTGTAGVSLPFTYDVNAVDTIDDLLTFELVDAPFGATIDPSTGVISWTPSVGQLGTADFDILVTDQQGATAQQAFSIDVELNPVNTDPEILSTAPTEVWLGSTFTYAVKAVDVNGDPLTFALANAPAGMTIEANGTITWKPSPSQTGDNEVSVTVDDGRGGVATQDFTLIVATQPVNLPPQITTPPITTAVAGQAYRFEPVATDPNNDALVWELVEGPEGMIVDQGTGVVLWNPTTDDLGSETVVLRVYDSSAAFSELGYTLNVRAVNTPPVIQSVPLTSATVGATYFYGVAATDADGDRLTYALTAAPAGMMIDSATGIVSWTPQSGQEGTNAVEVTVNDGNGGVISQSFNVETAAGISNAPPSITTTPGFFASADELYSYDADATDPEGTAISFELLQSPSGMTIDTNTGLIEWTPATSDLGTTIVRLVARDAAGAGSIQEFSLTVLPANNVPVITSSPETSVTSGGVYRYDVLATDADGEFLTYELTTAPAGMLIDGLGRIFWSPTSGQSGDFDVEVRVRDPRGGLATQAFTVNVEVDTADPQVAVLLSSNPVNVGETVDVRVSAIDNVGVESLTLTIDGVAVALNSSGLARVPMNSVGSVVAEATATDAAGNTATNSITIFVADPNDTEGPVLAFGSPTEGGIVTALTDVIGTVTDDSLVEYRLLLAEFGSTDFQLLATGDTNISDGVLGQIDPTLLANGTYVLRLQAVDAGGRSNTIQQTIEVTNENKLGNFRLSFTDLAIPVNGVDIVLSRTYDSLNSQTRSDFGFGWNMDFRDVQLQVSVPEASDFDKSFGFYTPYREGTRVYVTLPGGDREGFTFTPVAKGLPGLVFFNPRFTADDGVTSTLTVANANLSNSFGDYYAFAGGQPYNPAAFEFGGGFTLTTKEGLTYRINAETGQVTRISDPNGNRLDFSDAGVTSNSGVSITFERDAAGRITAAVDPNGQRIVYGYSEAGDLITVTDRNGNTSTYKYESPRDHYLTEVVDPLGNTGIRGEYDDDGRLVSLTDADGNSLEITTNLNNNTQVVVDDLGNQTIYQYDDRGNTTSETNALGHTTTSTFDSNNNKLTEIDPLGRVTTYTYDAFDNILTITDAAGAVTSFTYANAQRGLIATITDPLGNTTTYTYDSNGNPTSFSDTSGLSSTSTYDANGNLSNFGNPLSGTKLYEYDTAGNQTSETDAEGNVSTFTYDSDGRLLTRSWSQTLNGVTEILTESFVRDANGNVVKETNALGHETLFAYDANDRLITETDPLGRITRFVYDNSGQLLETIYPDATPADLSDNPRTFASYDALGRQTSQTDELGRTTYTVYDSVGQVIETIYPDSTPADLADNPRVKIEYDAAGQVTAMIDENGNRTEFEYDLAGNRVLTRDALGNETNFEFDAQRRQTKVTDALGQEITYAYDDAGRATVTEYADGSKFRMVYDGSGLLTSQTDQNGNTTTFEYDSLGRLNRVTEANGAVTEYEYDEPGNLVTITDANNHETEYHYDALGRRISVQRPSGAIDLKEFDGAGNQIAYTDYNGDRHTFAYDERNRLIRKSIVGEADATFTYLQNGLVDTIVDARGITDLHYDERNRLVQQTDPDGRMLSYSYDAVGNTLAITTLAGTTSYTYDALNRMQLVTDINSGLTDYDYDAIGRRTRTEFDNGVIETRAYDALNRVLTVESMFNSATFDRYTYTYDAKGNRSSVTDLDGRRLEYLYDSVDRLTSESVFEPGDGVVDRVASFTFDAVGNRLTRTDTIDGLTTSNYDVDDRLITEVNGGVTTTYGYDANGNRISKSDGVTATLYEYSGENRLLSVDTDGDSTADVFYEYDTQGNRVSRTESGSTIFYQVDSNRTLSETLVEYESDGTVVASYTLGRGLISQARNGVTAYYHTDALGSTTRLTGQAGNVLNTYFYDAFGGLVVQTGTFENEFLFDGQRRDMTTGLDYLRARNYDASTGRFTSVDPFDGALNAPITLNDYVYANANPTTFVDPSGNFSIVEFQFVQVTLIDIQKAFVSSAFDGLKRVARVADHLLVPGTTMQNLGLAMVGARSTKAALGFKMYTVGAKLRAAGFRSIEIALKAIYLDTAKSLAKVKLTFGPVTAEVSFLKDEIEFQSGIFKKKVGKESETDRLLKQYIGEMEQLLKVNDLQRFIQKGTGPFEEGANRVSAIADVLISGKINLP